MTARGSFNLVNTRRCGFWLAVGLCASLLVGCRTPREASKVERNVVYGKVGRKKLVLDMVFPSTGAGPRPVVVYLHGGAWSSGSKSFGTGWDAAPELLRRGYVFVAVAYRLAPRHKFPAQIEDAKCAIRFLRAHAAQYDLDPNRIVAIGGSAGGHLSALLGTTDASVGFDNSGGWTNESSRIQAVVDMFGHADLVHAVQYREPVRVVMRSVFGTKSSEEILRRFSPVNYVTADDPPFLLVHGERDGVVPMRQSELMKAALEKENVPVDLIVVKHAGHCLFASGGRPKPSNKELGVMIADFVDRELDQPARGAGTQPAIPTTSASRANSSQTP